MASFARTLSLCLAICLMAPVFSASAAPLKEPITLSLIAQQPGTSFYSNATTLSRFMLEALPKGSVFNVIPRGGSMSNPTALDQGKGDFALTQSAATVWAWEGLPEVYGSYGKHKNLRYVSIGQMTYNYSPAVARKAYVEQTGNDTLEKVLNAKEMPRLGMKPQGSIVIPIFNEVFKAYGKNFEDYRKAGKVIQAQPSQIGEMMRDGRVDVYFENIAPHHPAFTEVALTNDLVYLPISEKALKHMANLGMPPSDMPVGSFRGITKPYTVPNTSSVILAHKDANEEAVYLMTKAIIERRKELLEENPMFNDWDPVKDHDRTGIVVPLHPGAERYYKEIGWVK